MLDFVNGDALGARCRSRAGAATRHQGAAEAELGRLAQTRLALAHRTDLAAQSDLAVAAAVVSSLADEQVPADMVVFGEIGRRLADAQATRDIEINVIGADGDATARFEHGQHHGEPVGVPADHGMARRGEGGGRDQRLDLCLLYTSPSPRDRQKSRMPSSA